MVGCICAAGLVERAGVVDSHLDIIRVQAAVAYQVELGPPPTAGLETDSVPSPRSTVPLEILN